MTTLPRLRDKRAAGTDAEGGVVSETYRYYAHAGSIEIVVWFDTLRSHDGKPLAVELVRLPHETGTGRDVTLRRHGWERLGKWRMPRDADGGLVAQIAPAELPERVNGTFHGEDGDDESGENGSSAENTEQCDTER